MEATDQPTPITQMMFLLMLQLIMIIMTVTMMMDDG